MINDFEKAFSDFLDRNEYDQAENALFSIVRISYTAGWLAAGGQPPPPRKVLELRLGHKGVLDRSWVFCNVCGYRLCRCAMRTPTSPYLPKTH